MRLQIPERAEDTWAKVSNLWARMPARLRGVVVTVAAALILLFVAPAIWPHAAPRGQILVGAEFGAVNGLLALGLVLTYRASRVINFSYGAMGALAATIGVELYLAHHVPWGVCIAIALVGGAVLGLFVDVIIRWRFFTAPRLIVMVVTIGLAQLFGGIQLLVPGWLGGPAIVGGFSTGLSSSSVRIFPTPSTATTS
jgi:branched-subunit amino acid ABC-type transport system permease component